MKVLSLVLALTFSSCSTIKKNVLPDENGDPSECAIQVFSNYIYVVGAGKALPLDKCKK